jgi:hypothetical protein
LFLCVAHGALDTATRRTDIILLSSSTICFISLRNRGVSKFLAPSRYIGPCCC